jgi:hydroxymethylbilane synthase
VPRDHELRLGTRGSPLALWQANEVAARIHATGGPPCRIVVIRTSGDRLQDRPLSEEGGKRLFVKEIEDALLRSDIDLAVHSSKDMSVALPEGLTIAGVLPREDPLDAVVLPLKGGGPGLRVDDVGALAASLGRAPSIGTGSVRRVAQLSCLVPGARFAPIRGNLETRLHKLDEGQHDALVLAAAGLRRLGFAWRISLSLPVTACVPAPGQGIVAIEIRGDDEAVRRAVSPVNDDLADAALTAERAVVAGLGGGCQTPIGALASSLDRETIELVAVVATVDGSRIVRAGGQAARAEAAALGARIAQHLIAQGADEILVQARLATSGQPSATSHQRSAAGD